MKVLQTYINGNLVAENGKTLLAYSDATAPNQFCTSPKTERDFCLYPPAHSTHANVIEALEGQLITRCQTMPFATNAQGEAIADVERDMLKIAVVNRYADVPPAGRIYPQFRTYSRELWHRALPTIRTISSP